MACKFQTKNHKKTEVVFNSSCFQISAFEEMGL